MSSSVEANPLLIGGAAEGEAARLEGVLGDGAATVYRALTGRATLELAALLQPALIVLDANLPDMAGVHVCRRLLADHLVKVTTPVLLATPSPPTAEQRLEAISAGARECVGAWLPGDGVRRLVGAYLRARLEVDRGLAECLVDAGTGLYNRRGLLRRAHELGAHATRDHEALACLVLTIDVNGASEDVTALRILKQCSRAVRTSGRLSDVFGRLEANQLGVFAPATNSVGTVRMACRLAGIIHSTAAELGLPDATVRLEAGYDAVADLGYMPMDPTTLLLRATRAMRGGRSEATAGWIRRFDSVGGGASS